MSLFRTCLDLARRAVTAFAEQLDRLGRAIAAVASRVPGHLDNVATATAKLVDAASDRHCTLMSERPTYRAELLAETGAVLAFVGAPAGIVSAALAMVGLYVASYGGSGGARSSSSAWGRSPSSSASAGSAALWDRFRDEDDEDTWRGQ